MSERPAWTDQPEPRGNPPDSDRNRQDSDRNRQDSDRDRQDSGRDRKDAEPDAPTKLPRRSWRAVLRRTVREFRDDDLIDWAAALTYYSVLSVFPGLLVLVSLIGLVGQDLTVRLISNLGGAAPGSVRDILTQAVTNLQHSQRAAGVLAVLGLLTALWSASGYIAAFMRASNAIYDVPEGRPLWKKLPIRVGVTLLMMVLLAVSSIGVVLTGTLAARVGSMIGIGSTAVTVWNIAKWPVLLLIVSGMFALLYWASPNVRQGFRWVTPGGLLAIGLWLVASGAFAFYVAHFGSYNKVYGSLATVIIFLVWLWISNVAILLGAELNAELERSRAILAGHPAEQEPYVGLRDPPKPAHDDPDTQTN
ncbi:MAG TPA: YihY/virulence factor BrkB family protein [Kineosporiaceae bacterium]|nr:YihY/virulence factor BrkB family protein [Kineosporiaceae bacterium]